MPMNEEQYGTEVDGSRAYSLFPHIGALESKIAAVCKKQLKIGGSLMHKKRR